MINKCVVTSQRKCIKISVNFVEIGFPTDRIGSIKNERMKSSYSYVEMREKNSGREGKRVTLVEIY